eukprot:309330_1
MFLFYVLYVFTGYLLPVVLCQSTSPNDNDQTKSDTDEIIIIAIVSGVCVLLCVVIGIMLYKKQRRQSLKKDIANLDIEEVTQSDTNKNDTKNINKNDTNGKNKIKIKNKNKINKKHKHSNDVLDIDEDDENAQKIQ